MHRQMNEQMDRQGNSTSLIQTYFYLLPQGAGKGGEERGAPSIISDRDPPLHRSSSKDPSTSPSALL